MTANTSDFQQMMREFLGEIDNWLQDASDADQPELVADLADTYTEIEGLMNQPDSFDQRNTCRMLMKHTVKQVAVYLFAESNW